MSGTRVGPLNPCAHATALLLQALPPVPLSKQAAASPASTAGGLTPVGSSQQLAGACGQTATGGVPDCAVGGEAAALAGLAGGADGGQEVQHPSEGAMLVLQV